MQMQIPSHLVNEHFDDRYFDIVSALDEAQQIFFRNNDILERMEKAADSHKKLVIGETGFGAGRTVVALMEYLKKSGLPEVDIEYNSVELYPVTAGRMENILSGFQKRAGTEIKKVLEAYKTVDVSKNGLQTMKIEGPCGIIEIRLWLGEALEMVRSLEKPCDVWFLDGHSPKKNPSIWRPELMMAIGEKTKTGGSCATFTVAGTVKKALAEAGFQITKLPGFGMKKQVLKGVKLKLPE